MAGGRGILGADGKLLIRSDGTVDVCEDCCGETPAHQLILCDGSGTNLYVSPDDADEGDGILYGGNCHTAGVETTLPDGGTLLDAVDFTVDADCCLCGGCLNSITPDTVEVTFIGITNCCSFNAKILEDVNGAYCLTRVGDCGWSSSFAATRRQYTSGSNCAGGTWNDSSVTINVEAFVSSGGDFTVRMYESTSVSNRFFQHDTSGTGCVSFAGSNVVASCAAAQLAHLGAGGSVSVVVDGC